MFNIASTNAYLLNGRHATNKYTLVGPGDRVTERHCRPWPVHLNAHHGIVLDT